MKRRNTPKFYGLAPLLLLALNACGPAGSESSTSSKSQAVTSQGGLDAQLVTNSVWNEGWCGEIVLTNQNPTTAVGTWNITLDLGGTTLGSSWSGAFSASSGIISVTPAAWNTTVAPLATTRAGFCASKTDGSTLPSVIAVSDDLPGDGGEDCVESPVQPAAGRVQMRVSNVDDFVYLTVNGLRSKTWNYAGPDQNSLIDVTRWFTAGQNEVRVQAMNTGGPANYSIELFVDGVSVLNRTCTGNCIPNQDAEVGILLDETIDLQMADLPEAQLVELSSDEPGHVYVNGQYMGTETPATLLLPPGSYELGLGTSVNVYGAYTGEYFKQDIVVQNCPLDVDLDQHASLPVQNATQVAILPIRQTYHGGSDDLGWLKDSDIPTFVAQAEATSDAWVKPFSYGLTEWAITLLPTVESVPLLRGAGSGDAPQTGQLLVDAGMESLRDQYDIIIFYYSTHHADDTIVNNQPCCIWAGGQEISYNTSWVRNAAFGTPSEGLYHESLHSYEWYNGWRQQAYNGADGLHGAEEHGYTYNQGGEADWLAWYRDFARGIAAETNDMRGGVIWPSIPSEADLYVGVFDTMRYGLEASRPSVTSPQALQALASEVESYSLHAD